MSSDFKLSFNHINKTYGGVIALKDVSMEVREGEIHGLVGKNGAGKSTLVDIMYGVVKPDSGDAFLQKDGKKVRINFKSYTPEGAQHHGIFLVPQEPPFALDLTIEENFFMASPILKDSFRMDKKKMENVTKNVLQEYDLDYLDPNMLLSEVSIEDRHLLYTALVSNIRSGDILLLDEVTAALRKEKVNILFNHLNRIKRKKAVIFISHRVDEVIKICDRVTVIRDGQKICTKEARNVSEQELADLIVGENVKVPSFSESYYLNKESKTAPVLEVKDLQNSQKFKSINFQLKEGEILGITGLVGSGVHSLFRTLVGLEPPTSGTIIFEGKEVLFKQPKEAMSKGIAYGTDDRINEAIFPKMSILNNVNVSIWGRLAKYGFLNHQVEINHFKKQANKFNIKYSTPESNINSLSGGNQQKAVLARLNSTTPKVYLLDGPTKGIDVGSVYEILRLLRTQLTQEGSAVILNTPSIVELLLIADKIITFFEGRINAVFIRENFNEATIYKAIQGVDISA